MISPVLPSESTPRPSTPRRSAHLRRAALALAAALLACGGDSGEVERHPPRPPFGGLASPPRTHADATPPAVPFDPAPPRVAARAARSWPHDTAAFTQGLVIAAGRLLESTGLEGRSSVRELDRATGRVRRRTDLPATVFGEGIAVIGARLYMLTWQGARGYVFDAATLAPRDSFVYEGEGWGLATDGESLYMSDGTSRLRVVDPNGFTVRRTIQVREAGQPVWMLNELEWVRGELWANVYQTDLVARIEPSSGRVLGWVDLGSLLTPAERRAVGERGGVANGIAYDSASNTLLVTGKLWPRLFALDPRGLLR